MEGVRLVTIKSYRFDSEDIICPYCGYRHKDGWDYDLEQERTEQFDCCNEDCEKEFNVILEIETTYRTSVI